MFCIKCGNQIKEGNRFCEKCGAPVKNDVPKKEEITAFEQAPENSGYNPQPAAPAENTGYTPQPEVPAENAGYAYQQPASNMNMGYNPQAQQMNGGNPMPPNYGYAPVRPKKNLELGKKVNEALGEIKSVGKNTYLKVVSVMLAVLTVAVMLMGWTKLSANDLPVDIDADTTFNVFQFTNANGMIKDAINIALDEADEDDVPKEVKKIQTKSTTVSIVMIFGIIAVAASLILLGAYVFLSLINSKHALEVGMLSSIATVATVIIFIIAFSIFHSMLNTGEKELDAIIENYVSFRLTIPVFLTLFAAGGNFTLMLLKRKEIQA